MIKIIPARQEHAEDIARFIMMAMSEDCCRFLAGPLYSYDTFLQMMKLLVMLENSQYSYRNTLVAVSCEQGDETPVGICTAYDGALLFQLRKPFIDECMATFNIDHSTFKPETQAGEFYIDSLAVLPSHRGKGIASQLLLATQEKAMRLGLPCGLLVDQGNPNAEKLYRKLGFKHINTTDWASHPMNHMQTAK